MSKTIKKKGVFCTDENDDNDKKKDKKKKDKNDKKKNKNKNKNKEEYEPQYGVIKSKIHDIINYDSLLIPIFSMRTIQKL